ncbi:MAG: type II toxin-antitoxin system RelE/ParE family toxin [Spirulina sp. SIO3F2]|nr:type II toxin-antitoxin system RelE/ParE family toxin [Spirulina sp. SIO3F2]
MKTQFEASFKRDLKKLKDAKLKSKIKAVILECKAAPSLTAIANLKKLKGYDNFYRIRVGNHRLGITVFGDELKFVRCLQRKDIYRFFP